MNFSDALSALKDGKRICRAGWNGKNMWVAYSPGGGQLPAEKFWSEAGKQFAIEQGGTAEVLPCLLMKTADDKILMGWSATQTVTLADDWYVIAK